MGEQLEAIDFVYVDSDIPPGMSIPEWREARGRSRVPSRSPLLERDR
jgi:hypothetical protein